MSSSTWERAIARIFRRFHARYPSRFRGGRQFSTLDDLKSFLLEDLGLSPSSVQSAVGEMGRRGTGEIYPVSLTTRQMKKLGLGPGAVIAPASAVRQTRN
jgi:hypothetical protein